MKKTARKDGTHECPNCHQTIPPEKKKWFHWFIEWCPTCLCNASQMPVREDIGEDCILFEKIKEHNRHQRHSDKPFQCDCGAKLVAKYRHALADCNCIIDDAAMPIDKAPLLPGQTEGDGTFMVQAEYDRRKHAYALEKELLQQIGK